MSVGSPSAHAAQRRALVVAFAIGMLLTATAVANPAGAAQKRTHVSKLNPKVCPSAPVVAKALGVEVLQVNSNVGPGEFNINTCNYLTNEDGGAPRWLPLVSYTWPIPRSMFKNERSMIKNGNPGESGSGQSIVELNHVGNQAFVFREGHALWVESGTVVLELSASNATVPNLVALAKKAL